MEYVLVAVIPLVLLAGIVLFAVGNRGWNWGTITAAVLVLLAATGYTFLAGMLAQRERAWREIVHKYHQALAREQDAMIPDPSGRLVPDSQHKPLAALADDVARWQRVRDRIDTWRGRHWDQASFQPPVVKNDGSITPGRLTIEEVEKLTINPGAELYVFDAANVEDDGRFLGTFSVEQVERNSLTVVPTLAPSESDVKLWRGPHEKVQVYENLPVDRWMAFHRVATPKAEEDAAEGEALGAGDMPSHRKADPETLLRQLEGRLADVRGHAEPVPEEEWSKIAEELQARRKLPGTYWATVEFKQAHSFPRLRKDNDKEDVQFEPGQSATFDMETALSLKDSGVADIVSVEFRRPLADAQTAIRGTDYRPIGDGTDESSIRVEGLALLRRMLEADIAATKSMIARLEAAMKKAKEQLQAQATEGDDLQVDRGKWQADAEMAARVAERFEARLTEAGADLEAVEMQIVELGRELDGASALLVGTIDTRTPPPRRGRPGNAQ